jgi:predicted metallo-beta-lactamase superfamily hydrolase
MEYVVTVLVALIGGPIMWLLRRLDKNNSEQHGQNLDALRKLDTKVDIVTSKIDHHVEWHLDRAANEDTNN